MMPPIHFAARQDAEERPHVGPAFCKAGMAHRTEHEQLVAGDWAFVDCKNCHRILAAYNRREDTAELRKMGLTTVVDCA